MNSKLCPRGRGLKQQACTHSGEEREQTGTLLKHPGGWQGQGLATHAARAVLEWGHAALALVRIQATVLDSNARSIAVLERLGMQREGLLRAYRRVRGQPRDFWMYARVEGSASPC